MGCTSNKHQKQNSTNNDNCMYAQWVKNRLLAFKKNIDFHPDALGESLMAVKKDYKISPVVMVITRKILNLLRVAGGHE